MAYLTVGGTTIPIADEESERIDFEVGEVRRAFSGAPRSSVRAYKAGWKLSTPWVTRSSGNTYRGLLEASPPLTLTGDVTGSVSGYALNISTKSRTNAAGAEVVKVSFELWQA